MPAVFLKILEKLEDHEVEPGSLFKMSILTRKACFLITMLAMLLI